MRKKKRWQNVGGGKKTTYLWFVYKLFRVCLQDTNKKCKKKKLSHTEQKTTTTFLDFVLVLLLFIYFFFLNKIIRQIKTMNPMFD